MIRHWHLLGVALLAAAPLSAQSVVATPTNTQGWGVADLSDVRGGGSVAITGTYPRSGNGSLELQMSAANVAGSGKAAYTNWFAPYGSGGDALNTFSSGGFDWYRSSTSTVGAQFTPSYQLIGHSDQGYTTFVWENVYQNGGTPTAATNSWNSVDMSSQLFWANVSGVGPLNTACGSANGGGSQLFLTMAQWASSNCLSNVTLSAVSVDIGSGWGTGTFDGAADNVNIGFSTGFDKTTNFELDTVATPEPSSLALLGTGLFGLVPMIRRRRK